jgi:RNA polymerase sigma-70 factor (ECF subfamily)
MLERIDEHMLVEELKNGSYEAFDTLYMAYSPLVEKFAYALLKSRQEADDLSQGIFLTLWEKRSRLGNVKCFRSYLFAMVRNAVFDQISSRRGQPIEFISDSVLKSFSQEYLEEKMDVENFKVFINIAVSLMPEQRRKVFVMSRIKEKTHKEIAESLGISVKTVEYHISKALASIREIMKNM